MLAVRNQIHEVKYPYLVGCFQQYFCLFKPACFEISARTYRVHYNLKQRAYRKYLVPEPLLLVVVVVVVRVAIDAWYDRAAII